MKKILIAVGCLAVVTIMGLIAVYHYCPILLKYCLGEARDLGEPVNAAVYTDGRLNTDVKVYNADISWGAQKTDNCVLSLKEFDKDGMLKFIIVDLRDTLVGRPVGTSSDDYNMVRGHLFQSEVGYHFIDFRDDIKGFSFNPNLKFDSKQISFDLPPKFLKFSAIRIDLN